MNPHYDIDWTETYKAYIASGKTMAAFWRQDLSNHCRGSLYPTYQRFVKRINNLRMRQAHAAYITGTLDLPILETDPSEVKVITLTEEQIKHFVVPRSVNEEQTTRVEVRYPNGMQVCFNTHDPQGFIFALTRSLQQ